VGDERGQGTVEWVGLVCLVALVLVGVLAAGVRVPGTDLARAVAQRVLCAAELADGCGDEPTLIATYGDEIGRLVRRHMPTIAFEDGSHAVPVDYRRCRETDCGDAPGDGLVHRTDEHLPVTAFVHVIDCRAAAREASEAAGIDCSDERAGRLYLQYWLYYANSATLRGVPIVGDEGEHRDDWESVQVRINPDGSVDERASAHDGYDYSLQDFDWGSDIGFDPLRELAETLDDRHPNGWGPETGLLLVSGGSHAGNVAGAPRGSRFTPGRRVHLVPLEPIAANSHATFVVVPPWLKEVWRDPEASGTG
jgi:8-oxo-dGTP pyrophosphatase MutT (NUDIX family)